MKFGADVVKFRDIDKKIEKLSKLSKKELAEKFNCEESEVLIGDFIAKAFVEEECPYKVIVGFANFEDSNVKEGKLEVVIGRPLRDGSLLTSDDGYINYLALNTQHSAIVNCKSIKKIYGNWMINDKAETIGSVRYVYGSLYLNKTNVKDTGDLKYVDTLSLDDSNLRELNIEHIGKLISTKSSYITNFANVKKVDRVMLHYFTLKYRSGLQEINNRKRMLQDIESNGKQNWKLASEIMLREEEFKRQNDKMLKMQVKANEFKALFEANFKYDGTSWVNKNTIKEL